MFSEQADSLSDPVKASLAICKDTIGIVEVPGAVQRYTHKVIPLFQIGAQTVSQQRSVGLQGIADGRVPNIVCIRLFRKNTKKASPAISGSPP